MKQEPSYDLKKAAQKHGFTFIPLPPNAEYQKGRTYWCGYWSRWYQVINVNYQGAEKNRELVSVTIRWQDGTVGTHCTPLHPAWDWELQWPEDKPPRL